MRARILLLLVMALSSTMLGCDFPERVPQQSASGAVQAAPAHVHANAEGRTVEQQNIYDRIRVTTDPTKVLWIHLIGLDGSIINRMAVRGKVTSSGKRLEPTQAVPPAYVANSSHYQFAMPTYGGYCTSELIQPDGTYGSSDQYIFWFDPMGRYHQWGTAGGLGYLITDYPINIEDPIDKITGLYRANEAALAWQKEQEAQLRAALAPTPERSNPLRESLEGQKEKK